MRICAVAGLRERGFMKKICLILENGEKFHGVAIGAEKETIGEVVFTTGMSGYVETLTDPSFFGQIVVQTFPLIGDYGVMKEDFESDRPHLSAQADPHRARVRRYERRDRRGRADRGIDGAHQGIPPDRRGRERQLQGALSRQAGQAALQGHDDRLRRQAQHRARARGERLRRHRRAARYVRREDPRRQAGRHNAVQRPRRPRREQVRDRAACQAAKERHPDVRHLSRASIARARQRDEVVQTQIRPPRRKPARQGRGDGQGVHHQPKPRVRA